MAFDGIVTKKVTDELTKIIDYKIDKIYQPDKNTVILGLYGNFTNVALLSCISSNNYRIHLTTHTIKNPNIAPNFCMLLRKHILGYKIKNIYTKNLDRLVFIDLENSENPNNPTKKSLIIELMGKHSNIILLDNNGIVIDAIRHTSTEENAQRDIYPTVRYFPPKLTKYNLLEINNFDNFYSKLNLTDEDNITSEISNKFNGIGLSNLKYLIDSISAENNKSYTSLKSFVHQIYNKIIEILNSDYLYIKVISTKNNLPNDYSLITSNSKKLFSLNYSLDDFYFSKESSELFFNYRNTLLNIILCTLKKYEKRLNNIDAKLTECSNMEKYKLYGELITANLYKIPAYNVSEISLENYYDNNKIIKIQLDKKYSPQINAKHFFKKYNKLKNASIIVQDQKQETLQEIEYIQSVVYELDNCSNIDELQNVYEEISESDIFKLSLSKKKVAKQKKFKNPKKMTNNKFSSFNPLKYVIDGYTIYVGRNNKENDFLTNKFASKNDIWFHAKDIHGSHVILKANSGEIIPENVIYEAAKLAALHSKAKSSSNIPVDYCFVQFVKKVPGNKPGLVIYRNNKTLYI